MAGRIEARLAELGIDLPEPAAPAANYVPYVLDNGLLYVSGQLPATAAGRVTGRLGDGLDVAAGAAAARICGLNLLGQARAACGGDLDRIERLVKLTGFVNSTPDFGDQPQVVNGASDLMAEVLGDAGKHARSAVGVAALPFGVAVEIEAIFRLR